MQAQLFFHVVRSVFISGLACLFIGLGVSARAASEWIDVSSALTTRLTNDSVKLDWPGGCSGVVVNRTNGEVTVKVVGQGLWRSVDQGQNWRRIDDKTISGRDETGWATITDPESPGRMASFSLDGSAGWTADGARWQKFASLGRNWDFGSVDWSVIVPKTIIAAKHETSPAGEVYVSQDGGAAWRKLDILLGDSRGKAFMVGALGGDTVIYSKGEGIHRSTDAGRTWTKVSPLYPQTRISVSFRGVHYLGGTNGLIVSRDQGATWREHGAPVNIWLGPFFGRDEKEMLVVGKDGAFVSRDAGVTWKLAAALKSKGPGFLFTPNWFGCYAWDPMNNLLYASSMGNPVFKLAL
jgi:hypothetical protein